MVEALTINIADPIRRHRLDAIDRPILHGSIQSRSRPDNATTDLNLPHLLLPQSIIPNMRVNSKKQVLQLLARKAANLTGRHEHTILGELLERERLGTTGIGNGVAIPHCKLPDLERVHGLFARLQRPVDFDAIDGQPVALVFLLLAPEAGDAGNLRMLARVSRLFHDHEMREKLLGSDTAGAVYAILTQGGINRDFPALEGEPREIGHGEDRDCRSTHHASKAMP
jgi:PTS system nitrogen regulatory IIA component